MEVRSAVDRVIRASEDRIRMTTGSFVSHQLSPLGSSRTPAAGQPCDVILSHGNMQEQRSSKPVTWALRCSWGTASVCRAAGRTGSYRQQRGSSCDARQANCNPEEGQGIDSRVGERSKTARVCSACDSETVRRRETRNQELRPNEALMFL